MYQLSKPQKLIYDMEQYAKGSIAVICGSFFIKGKKDISELKKAVNELYRLNDALRIQITETDGKPMQSIREFAEQDIDVLHFKSREELTEYGETYAKVPLDLYGLLCEIKIILQKEQYGIFVKLHHIIGDAWTMALICNQFQEILKGSFVETNSYLAFLEKEQEYLRSKRCEKDRAFFLEQFRTCDEITYLSEKKTSSFESRRKSFFVNAETARQISDYAKEKNASVFTVFMLTVAVYISRIKMNVDKFYIGTAILNRLGKIEKHTMGMFVNTVPLFIDLNQEASFAENLSMVQGNLFSVFRHQKYNYGDVLLDLRKEYGFTEKLYDVVLSYQNARIAGETGSFESTWYPCGAQTESLQIHMEDRDGEGVLGIHFDYQTEKYGEDEIERMYDHMMNLLLDALSDDRKQITELSLLSAEERRQILQNSCGAIENVPKEKLIHELLSEQAEKQPDRTAVIACDRTLTYRDLDRESDCIAACLVEQGVKAGDIVAFSLPRKSYILSAMFGILKAGAAYLPIDPDYPKERIEYMKKDSKAKVFITEHQFEEMRKRNLYKKTAVRMTGENLCYCIYTSGSTGTPKGMLVRHFNVMNLNHEVMKILFYKNCKTVVSVSTVTFDIFVVESILPVINGIKVVFADEEQAKLQPKLNALLKKNPADVIQTTPSKLRSLILEPLQKDYLKNLKLIVLGGEVLEQKLVDEIRKSTEARILNIYGPTETTVYATYEEISKETDVITIGKPIANTQVYITDKFMNLLPLGAVGEICIAGEGVGAGYLNAPQMSQEKFKDNPFGKGKIYKSGDLAYRRKDGRIAYVGRNDFQVKIRGLRIELEEIENVVSSIEGISQAAVVVRKNEEGKQLICAFYTGKVKRRREIRNEIAGRLPKYMLPHVFVHLDQIPFTSGGKMNRRALPQVDLSNIEYGTQYARPQGETEQILAVFIAQTLQHSPVGRNDHFFEDLGADSLNVIEFVSKAHSRGIYFSVQSVFDYPTVAELARFIQNGDRAKISWADADFGKINKILAKNKKGYGKLPEKSEIGNLLLTGATGFLGIHILADFLEHDSGTAYCLVRGKDASDSKQRLKDLLAFYFRDRYLELLDSRIKVITADLQKDAFGLTETEYSQLCTETDLVIHAAASVKHYGSYQYFYEKNVETVNRVIQFCLESDTKLVHISTLSVSGFGFGNDIDFDETRLYVGQNLDNVYIRSKFEAEKAVLDVMDQGLSANIMRMGNLTNRVSDAVFQKNYETNAFLNRIRAILAMGILPENLQEYPLEFTPVDLAAKAVMTAARHFSREQTVFHINHPITVSMETLFSYFCKWGISMGFVSSAEFSVALQNTMKNKDTAFIYETFIGEMDSENHLVFDTGIHLDNHSTVLRLKQAGFWWQPLTEEYFRQYYTYFKKMGYFI